MGRHRELRGRAGIDSKSGFTTADVMLLAGKVEMAASHHKARRQKSDRMMTG